MRLKENINEFKKLVYKHDRIFIMGTGSSLNDIPPDMLIKLEDEFVIGITYSYLNFIPDVLMWADQHFTDHLSRDPFAKKPLYFMRGDAFDENKLNSSPEFKKWVVDNIDYSFDERGLGGHLTSSWLLQILKDYPGCIYLLGFDFYRGHSYTEDQVGYNPLSSWVTNNLGKAIDQHKGFKMKIYNCNESSRLKCYPKINISEML